jgi:ATP-binding cassette subfamily B protein
MSTSARTLHIYWQHAKKYKKQLWTIYPLMTIAQLAEDFLTPLIISGVMNKLASGDIKELQNENLWLIFAAIVALEILAHTIWNIVVRIFWRTQDLIMFDLNMSVFNHLQKMSFRFFANRFAGSLVSQTNKFVGSFERLTDPLTWNVFKLVVSLILTTIFLMPKSPIVSFAILLIAAIYTPIVWKVRRTQIPMTTRWAKAETARTGQLADTVSNIVAVKSFANEKLEKERMYSRAKEVHERSMDTMRLNMRQEYGTGALQRSINLSVIVLSIILASKGYVEVGTIYLSLIYTLGIMRRLWDLNNTFRQLTRVFGDASDMTEILQIEPEVADPKQPIEFNISAGEVSFNNVTFRYRDGDRSDTLFSNLSLNIKPGEKIGLVGPSGGGKTTITKLLLRFMDIQDGEIKIDNQNIALAAQADVRRVISYVPQEPLLFHRSIAENIAYGNLEATKEEIVEAAKQAHAHEFVVKLSDGYDTLVGERGVKLSGGQKQRIAIARTLLKDAPILVLDEATSALDSESEVLIQKALWKLMEGRTAIVIAHRLSTIQKMDRIIVLDNGKIAEEGTHAELVKKKTGLYARLWSHQSGGFLQD